jgi:uncharacterized membrane protein
VLGGEDLAHAAAADAIEGAVGRAGEGVVGGRGGAVRRAHGEGVATSRTERSRKRRAGQPAASGLVARRRKGRLGPGAHAILGAVLASELLHSIPMFEGLSDEDLGHLASNLAERQLKAGEMIFNQGDTGSSMYIVAVGHVNIHLPGEASRRVSLKDIARGEYFGELALFDDKPRSASALATTDATLLELSREMLSDYLERRPRAAMAILRTMAERLRETNAMLSERAAKNVVEEIDKNLTWQDRLADKVAELNGSWSFIIGLGAVTCLWMVINKGALFGREAFDPYPYVFFNLLLAVLVALQGPLIVMSQNRQSLKDRAQAETDFKVNLKNEVNIETILRELGEFRAEANDRLADLEKRAGVGAPTPKPPKTADSASA